MTVPSDPHRYFRLYHCAQHGHYHLISGKSDVSWPLWSREGILNMVTVSRTLMQQHFAPADQLVAEVELQAIAAHANALTAGGRLPLDMIVGEREVCRPWQRFRRGQANFMPFVATVDGFEALCPVPLRCDFVGRTVEPPLRATSYEEWQTLARTPARIVALDELGEAGAANLIVG